MQNRERSDRVAHPKSKTGPSHNAWTFTSISPPPNEILKVASSTYVARCVRDPVAALPVLYLLTHRSPNFATTRFSLFDATHNLFFGTIRYLQACNSHH